MISSKPRRGRPSISCGASPVRTPSRLGIDGTVYAVALFAALVIGAAMSAAHTAGESEPPPLVFFPAAGAAGNVSSLTGDGEATLASLRDDPNVSGLRIGHSAPGAVLRAAAFSLALSPGHTMHFRGIERTDHPNGMVSLQALDATAGASIVIDGQDVLGSMHDRSGHSWRMTPLGGGRTAVYRYDMSKFLMHPPGWDPGRIPDMETAPDGTPEPGHPSENTGAEADTGEVIDVMVIYTRAAREKVGNIDSFIQMAFNHTTRHYENSNLPFRLRLVHQQETDYTESESYSLDLNAITWQTDGRLDEVHALRDRHGADLVYLFASSGANEWGGGCGAAYNTYREEHEYVAFGIIAVECEHSGSSVFTHEIGHNLGADHDIANTVNPIRFSSYAHGQCHPLRGWATVMAYVGINNNCSRYIPYFSSPVLRYQGDPTGDAERMDNRRVLLETHRIVANFRQSRSESPPPEGGLHATLPYVAPAGGGLHPSLVRVLNDSAQPNTVQVVGYDDTGRRFGPEPLSIGPREAATLTTTTLESGGSGFAGIGDGEGWWRLVLTGQHPFRAGMYYRTADRFMAELSAPVDREEGGSGEWRYDVGFFNPGSNTSKVSLLRLANPTDREVEVVVAGRDDRGREAPGGTVGVRLPAQGAATLTAQMLEDGGSGFTGRLGDGEGKWRLTVTADGAVRVMSVLHATQTGHLANLSAIAQGAAQGSAPPPPPGGTFRDCVGCPEMVVVPSGSFMMGSPESDEDSHNKLAEERPVHRVTIARPFAVGVYEVTFGEWDACVSDRGCVYRPGDSGWGRGSRPVINVSWGMCRGMCRGMCVGCRGRRVRSTGC